MPLLCEKPDQVAVCSLFLDENRPRYQALPSGAILQRLGYPIPQNLTGINPLEGL